jgi:endonuclease/exonuclease/phosphatase family metal-dependent hydrolase
VGVPLPKPTRRILNGRLAVYGLAICALAVWIGSNRLPADATAKTPWHGVPKHKSLTGNTFRIASFNIHGGKGQDRKCDLSRVANCIRGIGPQFVGLYEVHGTCFGTRLNQADELGEHLGMASLFVPTENRFWQPSFGNGLLTEVETTPVHKLPLPCTQGRKYRTATLTSFEAGGETIKVLSVHLDRVKDREVQLQQVFSLFCDLEAPAILMGDLNTTPDDPLLESWLENSDIRDAVREKCGPSAPDDRIDWIFTRGLSIRNAGLLANEASDHPLVWADLEILPEAKREPVPTK